MNRILLLTSGSVVVLIIAAIFFVPDLPLYLRIQAAQDLPTTSITKTFSWTPSAGVEIGERKLTIVATDDKGASTTKEITINVNGRDIGVDNVQVTPQATEATVAWQSVDLIPSIVDFDVNQDFRKREQKLDLPAQQHSLALPNLIPCTTYTFRLVVQQDTQEITSDLHTFTTQGCIGNSTINGTVRGDISVAGGNVELLNKISVEVPEEAIAQETHFQIHQLERDAVLAQIGKPSEEVSPITGLYQLGAASDPNTSLNSFSQPVTVTLHYTPSADMDINTLSIYRYDGITWSNLSDCSVVESSQTISCTTTAFSAVAGFVKGTSSEDPPPEPPSGDGGDSGGGGGGDSGGGGGGGDDEPASPSRPQGRTYAYQVESGHKIEGSYSGVLRDGSQTVVKLAHAHALLSRDVQVPQGDYWLDVRVKHDTPGPVDMAVYLDNRAWKVIRLDKGDNRYHTHRVGLLRNFRDETIRFRFLNDAFDQNNPANETTDRNLFIDWWRLTTDDRLTAAPASSGGGSTAVGGGARVSGQTAGVSLMPKVNSIIREELGSQNVNFATWHYYAWRLAVPANHRAVIQSEEHLRTVMRYWKGARPNQPYGEIIK